MAKDDDDTDAKLKALIKEALDERDTEKAAADAANGKQDPPKGTTSRLRDWLGV